MTERQQTYVIAISGALAGAAASYLLFTDRGQVLRRQIGSMLDELEPKLTTLVSTIERTLKRASDSWDKLDEAVGRQRSVGSSTATMRIPH